VFLKKLTLLIIGLVLLTACVGQQEKVVEPTPVVMEEVSATETICSGLKNERYREACAVAVESTVENAIYTEALDTFDLKSCNKLSSVLAEECTFIIESSNVKGPIAPEEYDMFLDAFVLVNEDYDPVEGESYAGGDEVYDPSRCDTLQNKTLKEFCSTELARLTLQASENDILNSGDLSKCDTLGEENLITECKKFIEEELVYVEEVIGE